MLINFKKNKGFSLIELLVVISIMAILATVVTVNVTSYNQRARDARRKTDLVRVRETLQQYFTDNGKYPTDEACGLTWSTTSTFANSLKGYIDTLPQDPKAASSPSKNYCYKVQAISYTAAGDIIPANGGFILMAQLENANDSDKKSCASIDGSYTQAYSINVDYKTQCQ